jgi:hypothetical protein
VGHVHDLSDEELRALLWTGPHRTWPWLVTALTIGTIVFLAYAVGAGLGVSQTQQTDRGSRSWTPVSLKDAPDTTWMPSGFTDISGDGTAAYLRVDPVDPSCNAGGGSCVGYQIVTRDGCPSGFWLRVSVLNAIGAKINDGWAAGPPIWPGERADVTVAWDGPPGSRYAIYDFECRWPATR